MKKSELMEAIEKDWPVEVRIGPHIFDTPARTISDIEYRKYKYGQTAISFTLHGWLERDEFTSH